MFNLLKEKLKTWVKNSKEKVEKTAPKKEKKVAEKSKKEKKIKEDKKDKKKVKEDKIKQKEERIKEKQEKKLKKKQEKEELRKEIEEIEQKTPKNVEEAREEIKQTQEKAEKIQEIEKIEETKEEEEIGDEKEHEDLEGAEPLAKEDITEIKSKISLFSKLKSKFSYKITQENFEEIFEELEMLLLENNVALEVVEDIKEKLAEKLIGKEIDKEELENEITLELKKSINEILIEPDDPIEIIKIKKQESKELEPFVILFFGINGTGKTTSIAKFAHLLKKNNLSVVLAAGDTFRAASIEQISEHANTLKIPLIKHDYGNDPAAVGFDAIKYAKKHKIDVVLIDTAGRMYTKSDLMMEMEKINRITNPDLKIFVAESIAGNDATEQAKTFNEAIGIDGSILSKADIDEKGGTIISVSHASHKPIFYLGMGQKYDDLELFDKEKFVKNLGL